MDGALEGAAEFEERDSAHRRAYALFRNLARLADRHPLAINWLCDALRWRLNDLAEIVLEVTTETGAPMAVALIAELQRKKLRWKG